mmetsp:Transcript_51342/g.81583  ORF Transcript_51342/g.81583 Transcript_51342/m.81583 type:complete len:812 (-) Transcript_51342:207-2642(-)
MNDHLPSVFHHSARWQPHRYGRQQVLLPMQLLEADFPQKVQARAKLRRQQWPNMEDEFSKSLNISTSSTWPSTMTRPSTAPEGVQVAEPKYLRTACVPYAGGNQRHFKMNERPNTAPEFQSECYVSPDSMPETMAETRFMQIVESPTTIGISTSKGELKIPPRMWIVLQPSGALNRSEFGGRSIAEVAWPQLGKTTIPLVHDKSFQTVPAERLDTVSADAHLKRSIRGASMLVHRHAAYIKQLLRQRAVSGLEIVEAVSDVVLNTPKGEFAIAPPQWIVLGPRGFANRRLADAAGTGLDARIPEKGGSLLRLVPDERLHAVAAEANFKRASQGTSMLALCHAAYAVELLQQRDREACTESMIAPLKLSPVFEHEDRSARLSRVACMVKTARSAAKHRMQEQLRCAEQEKLQEKVIARKSKIEAVSSRILRGNKQMQKGVEAFDKFHEFVLRRYGNIVRAWFKLDVEENMKIGEKVFVRRCLDLGFSGNVTAMYRYIDSDRSGSVSLLELDPNAAIVLAQFKVFVTRTFGSPEKCFHFLDRNKSGRISKDDTMRGLGMVNYDGPVEELFDMLDREGYGNVVKSDLDYLESWKPRPYLFAKPDTNALKHLKESFVQVNGPPLFKTWRQVLDRDGSMRLSWEEFVPACRKHARQAAHKGITGLPVTEDELAVCWRALDDDCSGWIALKEFDPACFKVLKAFKLWAESEHGGVVKALKRLDDNENCRLSPWELRKSEKNPHGYPGDVEILYEYLDLDKQKSLGEPEVKFLDGWDVAWDEFEERSRIKRKTTLATIRGTERMGEPSASPIPQLLDL